MIKAEQLPQEQVETFLKENKAFKTTVLVVGAVGICLVPAIFFLFMFSFRFNGGNHMHFHNDKFSS